MSNKHFINKKDKNPVSFESVMIIGDPDNNNKGHYKGMWGTIILKKEEYILVRLDTNPYKIVKLKENCVKYKN